MGSTPTQINMTQPKKLLRLSIIPGILILTQFACRLLEEPLPEAAPLPVPKIEELVFEESETEVRFKSLNQCIEDMTDDTWRTTSYKLIGNFYESRWCSGTGAREDCQITEGSLHNRDQHQVGLYTLFYPTEPTTVFGLGFQSLWVPKSTGWGAVFYLSEKGKTIIGDGWSVTFNLYEAASNPATQSVTLGDTLGYRINETNLQFSSELPIREDLAIYLESPENMRDRGIEQYQLFREDVQTKLNNHEIAACEWGEYQGGGIPPICNPRQMTAEEEAEELEKARLFFEGQIQLLQEHHQEMYSALMNAFPFNACWN